MSIFAEFSLSDEVTNLNQSPTLDINQKIKTLRNQGRTIYHFGFGESPFPVHPDILKALIAHAHQKNYLQTQGLPELRQEVAGFYQRHFHIKAEAQRILIGPGSKELLFILNMILRGDILLPIPRWVSYEPQAQLLNKKIINIETHYESDYKIMPNMLTDVLASIDPETPKIMLLNSPNNPTGSVYTRSELEALVDVFRQHKITVISDEIYALVTFQADKFTSVATVYPEGTILTGGLSKDRSLGGYRLGVALFPEGAERWVQAAISVASETFSCVSTPIQYAACEAYRNNPSIASYITTCTAIHRLLAKYTWQQLIKTGLRCPEPQGGFYLFPDFTPFRTQLKKRGILTDQTLCDDILETVGVALLAGSHFGLKPDALAVRLSPVDYDGQQVLNAFSKYDGDEEQFMATFCPSIEQGCRQLEKYLSEIT